MNINKSDRENNNSVKQICDSESPDISTTPCKTEVFSETEGKPQTAHEGGITCSEISVLRSILEKMACVDQEDFTWTWDHETEKFLIQASNNVIEQYVNILKHELGKDLCLHLKRVSIIVDLRPWKTNSDKTSLRIGFEGDPIPTELNGHTGLEDLVKLHFISQPDDPPEIKKALNDFSLMCCRIDSFLEKKYEWMWEKHWKKDGLTFAVVRAYSWLNRYILVEKEIELFNSLVAHKQSGLYVDLSTYNRGTSFNVRIALNGLPNNLRKNTRVLDVFDMHYRGSAQ
ncbi:MAG: hypothetical protein WC373_02440 [Smithella sp.]|jgi:hypothetical protein